MFLGLSSVAMADTLAIESADNPIAQAVKQGISGDDFRNVVRRNSAYRNAQDPISGHATMHVIAASGTLEQAQAMFNKNEKFPIRLDITTEAGDTPFFTAIINKKYDIARLYMQEGANIMIPSGPGYGPLHFLAEEAGKSEDPVNSEAGKFYMELVEKGADPFEKEAMGNDSLHYFSNADEKKHAAFVRGIEKARAKALKDAKFADEGAEVSDQQNKGDTKVEH